MGSCLSVDQIVGLSSAVTLLDPGVPLACRNLYCALAVLQLSHSRPGVWWKVKAGEVLMKISAGGKIPLLIIKDERTLIWLRNTWCNWFDRDPDIQQSRTIESKKGHVLLFVRANQIFCKCWIGWIFRKVISEQFERKLRLSCPERNVIVRGGMGSLISLRCAAW